MPQSILDILSNCKKRVQLKFLAESFIPLTNHLPDCPPATQNTHAHTLCLSVSGPALQPDWLPFAISQSWLASLTVFIVTPFVQNAFLLHVFVANTPFPLCQSSNEDINKTFPDQPQMIVNLLPTLNYLYFYYNTLFSSRVLFLYFSLLCLSHSDILYNTYLLSPYYNENVCPMRAGFCPLVKMPHID